MGPLIDRTTGAVRLTDDLVLSCGFPLDRLGNYVTPIELGNHTKTFWTDPIPVNTVYGLLDVQLQLKKGRLRMVKMRVRSEFGPQQAMIKVRHDGFLTEMMGRPTQEKPAVRTLAHRLFLKGLGQDWPKAAKELVWNQRWGCVKSTVELREGFAVIEIEWNEQ